MVIHHSVRKRISDSFHRRWERAHQSRLYAVLVAVELVLAFALAIGLWVFWNPDINLIPAPLNQYLFWGTIAVLLFGLAIILYLFENRHFIKETAKEKFSFARKEKRIPLLLVLEFFLAMVLVLATFVYLDPQYNVLPWPFNIVLFLIVLGIVAYLYGFSKEFRKEYYQFFNIKKRW